MRRKIVAGNWKMNGSLEEGRLLLSEIIAKNENTETLVLIAPPFPHLAIAKETIEHNSNFYLAAQNCHQEDKGAFTGEVSAPILESFGVSFVIIGHSERREYFGETHQQLADKVDAVLGSGMQIVFCVGEKLEERETGKHFEIVKKQIADSLFHLNAELFKSVVIAYEPVWAIGTGVTASTEQAQEMHSFIRETIQEQFGNVVAEELSILYGGSCNVKNASSLFACKDIDGGLIGGASLKAADFSTIINAF